MERLLKKQIDDLLEYSLALKNMFVKLAQSESFPDEMENEDKKEINNILYIMNDALRIEERKVSQIQIYSSDLEAIEGYLLKFHEYTSYEDFAFVDNKLERLRVYNKLFHKYLEEKKEERTLSKRELLTDSFSRVIDSNFVYILNEHAKNPEVANLYGFLKYGKIFISPTYDAEYFPNRFVANIKPINYYPILNGEYLPSELTKFALDEIKEEFNSTIETLYNGFTNSALEDEENEIRVISMIMVLVSFLSTSLNPDFIDERYLEFQRIKKSDENYSDVNDMILSSLKESKRIVLQQKEKRN